MRIVGQVEIEEFPVKVLEKHWPKVKRWRDIRHVTANDIRRSCGSVDVIAGGFPCQDISVAGKQVGLTGERSGLWREMWRLIKDVRPSWVLAENVPALRTKGIDGVLESLEGLGYTCWPVVVGASDVGAPHQRKRIWIVAHNVRIWERRRVRQDELRMRVGHSSASSREVERWQSQIESVSDADSNGLRKQPRRSCGANRQKTPIAQWRGEAMGDADSGRCEGSSVPAEQRQDILKSDRPGEELADAKGERRSKGWSESLRREGESIPPKPSFEVGDTDSACQRIVTEPSRFSFPTRPGEQQFDWEEPRTIERGLGGTVDGISGRLDTHRLKALGNAVVPQAVELIGAWIVQANERAS